MTQDRIVLKWRGGGEGTIVDSDGLYATLQSTRQAAPGTPLWADVSMKSGKVVRFKVKGCKRLDEGMFVLKGRWVDLSKTMREEILTACIPAPE